MPVPEHVFAAARTGDVAVLREYFASGDRDPNDTVERTGWTLLDGACRGTRDEQAGLDWGGTPRVISCEVVSFLLSQGASVDYQDPDGTWHRPLALAAATCATNRNPYADEATLCAPLKMLIDAGADVNADTGVGSKEGFTPLMQAVTQNNKYVICFLLRCGATMDSGLEARRARALRKCQELGFSPAETRREVDEQTVEDWCRAFMDQERWRREPTLKFLIALRAAGGTMKGYLWAPRADLCMLRLLCEQGRASPRLGQIGESMNTVYGRVVDREERDLLERVFAWAPAHATKHSRRTRSAQAASRASHITPLPRGVFKLVLSFWESDRDWRWGY